MSQSKKMTLGILTIGLIVAFIFAGFVVRTSLAAAINQQAGPTATAPAPQGQTSTSNPYTQFFWKALATSLGVDEAKLKSAVVDAIGKTVDQMVTDGKLTQSQGDQIKQKSAQGVDNGAFGFPFFGEKRGWGGLGGMHGPKGFFNIAEFAKAIGIDTATLENDLSSGKSINDIASANGKDPKQVKQDVLATFKTQLDTAVSNGKMTQSQADTIYQNFNSQIDNLMSQPGNQLFFHRRNFMNPWNKPENNPGDQPNTNFYFHFNDNTTGNGFSQ